MRKIKLELQCRVPSWNFCNYDGYTDNLRPSKELCRFCTKVKGGYRCVLHDCELTSDTRFVHKAAPCIKATAGYAVTADEPTPLVLDPQTIIREAVKTYADLVDKLVKQGYPQSMAEKLAQQYMSKGR